MSADWTNEQAILHDLAIAQGIVPVESVETVSFNEKPPSVHIKEETEEHFLSQYVSDGNSIVIPDCELIQDMLNMVRDVRVNEIENSDDENTEENKVKVADDKPMKVVDVKKKNAAIESIINMQEIKDEKTQPVRDKKTQPVLFLQPESMFKPKSKSANGASASISNKSVIVSVSKSVSNESRTKVKPAVFVPSSGAQEYYNKLMEAKRQKELREETIWTRAERQMKEIEAKRNKVVN